jgi:integrase
MTSLATLATSFSRTQKAEGRSPATIALYRAALSLLARHLQAETGSDDLSGLSRRALTDFYAIRSDTCAKGTLWTYFKCHRVFLQWAVDEDELASSPIDRMKQPVPPVKPVPTFTDSDIARLLAACEGRSRRDKRDTAIVRLLTSTGLRRGELASLRPEDVDLDQGLALVTGKGKTRVIPLGPKTVLAIDRWMRVRTDTPPLFGLTPSGIYQMLRDRADTAGVPGVRTHRFRHDWASRWLSAGGSEGDAMALAGWSSRSLLDRYSASTASARAVAAHRRIDPGGRF